MTGFLLTAKQKLMLCINKRLYWTDRYKFYTMATRAYAVVATGELAPYASILLQKGDVTPEML